MNRPDPIPGWRTQPVQAARGGTRGWSVVFAMTTAGTIPALDYVEGTDPASVARRPFSEKQRAILAGFVEAIRLEGPRSLQHGKQFKAFLAPDSHDGMCELRFGSEEGHRLVCFQQEPQRFVIACGFLKPRQWETPQEHKDRARVILKEQKMRESAERRRNHGR